jgi:hypothetical protein
MRLSTSFTTRTPPERAFEYVADFGRIEEWDPFIAAVERLDPGPPAVGSRYVLRSRGPGLVLRYEVTALDPAARCVRLAGAATGFRGWDEISVEPAGGGSRVRYTAEIGLRGRARLLWLAAPLMLVAMALGGGGPLRGLRRRIDELGAGR